MDIPSSQDEAREGCREVVVPAPGRASSPGRHSLPSALTPALTNPNCPVKERTRTEEEKRTYRQGYPRELTPILPNPKPPVCKVRV